MLRSLAASLRYVDYRQAERDCERLAAQLLSHYRRKDLERFVFSAIPRGGWIVLGMLSYVLDLEPEQLAADASKASSVVLVDDCALTGARISAALGRLAAEEVVVAHLYSHPDLRRALVERESRVARCCAAHDLQDLADSSFPDPVARAAWRARWQDRLGPGRYWNGQPELVCFAWSEPDRPFFNSVLGEVEDGWRFLPPHRCLKNRAGLVGQRRSEGCRGFQAPAGLVVGDFDGATWLCATASGRVISLSGSGAEIWKRLASGHDQASTAAALVAGYGLDEPAALADVEAFAVELVTQGLLEPALEG